MLSSSLAKPIASASPSASRYKRRPALALPAPDIHALDRLTTIVRAAGDIALRFFKAGDQTDAKVTWKGDGSPVTEADYAVNAYLETELRRLWPDAAWLSEESADDPARLEARQVIIVDPIDGTRGFSRGDRHWCIAVALVEQGRPIMAIVHAPAHGETFTACAGRGARLNGAPITIAACNALRADMRVSAPVALAQDLRAAGVDLDFRPKIASLALRITSVASGAYDCCLASRNSRDWDLAAADLVLQEAGGRLAGPDGQPLVYNRPDTQHGVLTATAVCLQPLFLQAIERMEASRRST